MPKNKAEIAVWMVGGELELTSRCVGECVGLCA